MMASTDRFDEHFELLTGHGPRTWQRDLAAEAECGSRLIRIPTGFGKTLGVLAAWAFHRLARQDDTWPRRLVWCLPMRVLVEQTELVVRGALDRYGCLWDGKGDHGGQTGVHVLMGGSDAHEWSLHPEHSAVLIGTQDMLLSRALNRGYGSHRPRWPMEFGLLSQDALWVMDEVQLMDVGLATGAQLQAFRQQDVGRWLRPCHTWWMSATLQRHWLESVDTRAFIEVRPRIEIPEIERRGPLWDDVTKPCRVETADPNDMRRLAGLVAEAFEHHGRGRLTLVVVNRVGNARRLFAALREALGPKTPPDLHLVHSRFRPAERSRWASTFLRRDAPIPSAGRIVVATQVVEAGVDLDAGLLVTELAPWTSLVQRFGRAARRGGKAEVIVIDFQASDDKQAAPYKADELAAARRMLERVRDASPQSLEAFESRLPAQELASLYPYEPQHLLLRHEWDELFDTTPDLTGADVDISRFIRSGDERDLQVFWMNVPGGSGDPDPGIRPTRDALCNVPFLEAATWLCGKTGKGLSRDKRAWVWDWLEGRWRPCRRHDFVPGRTVLVAADCGGYDPELGWDGQASPVTPVASTDESADEMADALEDAEDLSATPAWKTIATHGGEVAEAAGHVASALKLPETVTAALRLAGRWHDLGKAHPAFQGSIRSADRPLRQDLAKAPARAWGRDNLYRALGGDHRPGFRHELASALALFAVLARNQPDHSALLGPHLETLRACGMAPCLDRIDETPTPDEAEVLALSPEAFDLVAYLVASHHGKVRCGLHAGPKDQGYRDADGRGLPVRGVREGDLLPSTQLQPGQPALPALTIVLEPAVAGLSPVTGASWTERAIGLQRRLGPSALGFLEACLRAADIRASRLATADPLLGSGGRP
jgi:CRISPR-associated endonuclease/helicase Cas3